MSLATNSTAPDVSVLVPAKDEADNLAEFVRLTREAMLPLSFAVTTAQRSCWMSSPQNIRSCAS